MRRTRNFKVNYHFGFGDQASKKHLERFNKFKKYFATQCSQCLYSAMKQENLKVFGPEISSYIINK